MQEEESEREKRRGRGREREREREKDIVGPGLDASNVPAPCDAVEKIHAVASSARFPFVCTLRSWAAAVNT